MKRKFLLMGCYGVVHFFASLTCVIVSATLIGISLPAAFFTTGLSTIIFHCLTKHYIPSINGISGSFVAISVLVVAKFGLPYLYGAVIVTGLVYILFGILLHYRKDLLSFIPGYVLTTCIVLVSLSLVPLGMDSIKDPVMMLITLVAVVGFSFHRRLSLYAMPFALLIATVFQVLFQTDGFQVELIPFSWTKPLFALEPILMLVLTGLAVLGEVLGDVKNLSNASQKDIEKEVGISRILVGNGLSTVISGFCNGGSIATYSESVGVVYATRYRESGAQLITAVLYMGLAFNQNLLQWMTQIPVTALGVLLVYLFITVFVNTMTSYDFKSDHQILVMILMLTVFYLTPLFFPTVSNIFLGLLVGIIADYFLTRKGAV